MHRAPGGPSGYVCARYGGQEAWRLKERRGYTSAAVVTTRGALIDVAVSERDASEPLDLGLLFGGNDDIAFDGKCQFWSLDIGLQLLGDLGEQRGPGVVP